jgi:16S rRNA (cytosine1402-N4)-methyltransferase
MHTSVLLEESIALLAIEPDGVYFDFTFGNGGHSRAILEKLTTGKLYSFDISSFALEASKKITNPNFIIVNQNFNTAKQYIVENNIKPNGVLFDLGLSSMQIDLSQLGFSYLRDEVLDMRMDENRRLTAAHVLNTYSFESLCHIFRDYGEEPNYYRLATKIMEYRSSKNFNTTFDLVRICDQVNYNVKGHSAKRAFQALRIEVNQELSNLENTLEDLINILPSKSRIVAISFHSLEDRIVKHKFSEHSHLSEGDKIKFYLTLIQPRASLLTKHPIIPSEDEMKNNSRSKSAKLRGLIIN